MKHTKGILLPKTEDIATDTKEGGHRRETIVKRRQP